MANQNCGNTPVINENESLCEMVINETDKEMLYSLENNNLVSLNVLNITTNKLHESETHDHEQISQCLEMTSELTDAHTPSNFVDSELDMTESVSTISTSQDNETPSCTSAMTTSEGSSGSADKTQTESSSTTCNSSTSSMSETSSQFSGEGFSVSSVNQVILRSAPSRGTRQAMSEFMLTSPRKRSYTVQDAKEQAHLRLQEELIKAQRELKLKDEECEKLSKVRDRMGMELEDLTASLFEEANKMVQDAHMKRSIAEKQCEETKQQIEALQADLAVFKSLVLTSTPNTPNRHLHPQINVSPTKKKESKPFWKGHRRSTSHHDFTNESRREEEVRQQEMKPKEIDHSCYIEFVSWRENMSHEPLDHTYEFLARITAEDIVPCTNFSNKRLSTAVRDSIQTNSLMIEPISTHSPAPLTCCLTDSPKICNYKIKLDGQDEWLPISQHCRNRIAAVCDFYTYIRYITQGLVKSDDNEVYTEVVRLRRQMAMARLGYT